MRLLKLLLPAAILGFTLFLTSCALWTSQTGLAAKDVVLRRDLAKLFPAIGITEPMSYGLACRILENDVNLYCLVPEAAPAGFPKALCSPGAQVCREVLGDPTPPAPPLSVPAPPGA